MAENSHSGHRKRLRKELIEQDFPESVPDHKVLEALLFYGVPQKDTNPLAHELINTFGSLGAVLEADAIELFQIKGMTERAVALIKMVLPLSRRYQAQKIKKQLYFKNVEDIADFLRQKHYGYGKEVFTVTTFNEKGNLIACDILNKGGAVAVTFNIKDVVQLAFKHRATYVIISHNHLSGSAVPSREDIENTKRLYLTLKQVDIRLVDHIILSDNDYISMASDKDYSLIFSL